ncbi:cell division protein ZapB [Celerinatantimonas yamalensis]|uniref:Cell division protein ZapB n=1 Tax=Celerinatantimonas yamalensis TaxID=559956 RepID=A0ABW9G8W7_9GAMM
MSFELLEELEGKIQSAVENIELLRMEIDELKEQNSQLSDENSRLHQEQDAWQERLKSLLGRMSNVNAES